MNEAWIKRACTACAHAVVQLTPTGGVRKAACFYHRDTAPTAAVAKSMRGEATLKLGACPLEEAA